MNSISSLLRMIDCDAMDYGGVQEVPEHRVGDGYRYFDAKRKRSFSSEGMVRPLYSYSENNEIVGTCSLDHSVTTYVDDDDRVWIRVKGNT